MRVILKGAAFIIAALIATAPQSASASLLGMPRALGAMVHRISFQTPTVAPMAFTMFCLRYPDQCKPNRIAFRGGPVKLTTDRWDELNEVNELVNAAITPERNEEGLAGEKWIIAPISGDCNDFAVTKRSELIDRGWPARALLLSEVVTNWGEHHLVLVVRTHSGDVVLDNMTPVIRRWDKAPYKWVRIQTPQNPKFWATISGRMA